MGGSGFHTPSIFIAQRYTDILLLHVFSHEHSVRTLVTKTLYGIYISTKNSSHIEPNVMAVENFKLPNVFPLCSLE